MRGADSGPSSGKGDDTAAWARPDGTELPEILEERPEEAPVPAPPTAATVTPLTPPLRGLPDDTGPWAVPVEANARPGDDGIRAAGGVVWTRWGDGRLRILVIHRPKYDDWSLPKGKCDPGEGDTACAEREVREETGLTCSVGEPLPSTTYLDRKGRPKTVRYFAMQPM